MELTSKLQSHKHGIAEMAYFEFEDAVSDSAVTPLVNTETGLPWAGIVDLAPHHGFPSAESQSVDLYLLAGSLFDDVTAAAYNAPFFLIRNDTRKLKAGANGARALAYKFPINERRPEISLPLHAPPWLEGRINGMRIAPLPSRGDQLMLVSWEPGTSVPFHTHPLGEDILVLSGELRNKTERFPAGTWMRLHRGSGHSPYATEQTTILLRNGHL